MNLFKKIKTFFFDFFKPDIETLLYIAGDPDTDEKTLSKLSTHPDWRVRRRVAGNEATSPETLRAMRGILLYIAASPDTDEKTLSKYSTLPDWGVRRAVAGNEATSPQTLHAMRHDKDELVIREIASNPKTEDKTLSYLAAYPCNHIQRLVCQNKKTPAEVLVSIASKDRVWQIDFDVKTAIAENPKTDAKTLEELLERGSWDTHCAIARHPNASKETLEKIVVSKGWRAREFAREELERREMEEKQGDK